MPYISRSRTLRLLTWIFIGGGILFLISSILFFVFLLFGNPVGEYVDKDNYESDVQLLYKIAQQAGYAEEKRLNFFRWQGSTTSNDDVTTLVFSTNDSIEIFSRNVDKLGLARDTSLGAVYGKKSIQQQFINGINEPHACSLVIADSTSEYCRMPVSNIPIDPHVTQWYILLSKVPDGDVRLQIHYAQLPSNQLFWKDTRNGNTIPGPIVVMVMRRYR